MYKNLLSSVIVSASPIWGCAAQTVIGKFEVILTVHRR